MNDIPELIDLATTEGINTLTVERFVPTGSGKTISNGLLTPEEVKGVFGYISDRANKNKANEYNLISRSRPLWILFNNCTNITPRAGHEFVGGICSVGLDGLCILPDATVLGCRRLPIPIGNLKEDSIEKIWFKSDLLWQIRDKQNIKGKCHSCDLIYQCSGCRAMAYAMTGDFLESDPQCWK
jgi:radical SAM protein with 4Fe4S-binding SPASM domain